MGMSYFRIWLCAGSWRVKEHLRIWSAKHQTCTHTHTHAHTQIHTHRHIDTYQQSAEVTKEGEWAIELGRRHCLMGEGGVSRAPEGQAS